MTDLRDSLSGNLASLFGSTFEDLIDGRDVLLILMTALAHWLKPIVEDTELELLACTITQATTGVVIFGFLSFPQRPAILKQLLQILSVEMLYRIDSYIKDSSFQNCESSAQIQDIEIGNTTSAPNIFCRFISLLEQTPVKNRPVSW